MPTDLELAADKHQYRLPSGVIAPSVTQITRLLDDGKSMGFAYAAVKLGPDFKTVWDERADRGTRIHAHCQAWLEGRSVDALEDERGYLDALQLFFNQYRPWPLEIERIVLSNLGYGGRFDFVCRIAGQTWIIDLKTGKPYSFDHSMQLSAYVHADGMATYSDGELRTRLQELPAIFRGACLHVNEDGTYEFIEYPVDLRAFECFKHLLALHQKLETLRQAIRDVRAEAIAAQAAGLPAHIRVWTPEAVA